MITGEVGSDLSLYVGYTSRRRFVPNEIHFGRSVCTQQRLENLAAVVVTGPQVLNKKVLGAYFPKLNCCGGPQLAGG